MSSGQYIAKISLAQVLDADGLRYQQEIKHILSKYTNTSWKEEEHKAWNRNIQCLLLANSTPPSFDRLLRLLLFHRIRSPFVQNVIGSRYHNTEFIDAIDAINLQEPLPPLAAVYHMKMMKVESAKTQSGAEFDQSSSVDVGEGGEGPKDVLQGKGDIDDGVTPIATNPNDELFQDAQQKNVDMENQAAPIDTGEDSNEPPRIWTYSGSTMRPVATRFFEHEASVESLETHGQAGKKWSALRVHKTCARPDVTHEYRILSTFPCLSQEHPLYYLIRALALLHETFDIILFGGPSPVSVSHSLDFKRLTGEQKDFLYSAVDFAQAARPPGLPDLGWEAENYAIPCAQGHEGNPWSVLELRTLDEGIEGILQKRKSTGGDVQATLQLEEWLDLETMLRLNGVFRSRWNLQKVYWSRQTKYGILTKAQNSRRLRIPDLCSKLVDAQYHQVVEIDWQRFVPSDKIVSMSDWWYQYGCASLMEHRWNKICSTKTLLRYQFIADMFALGNDFSEHMDYEKIMRRIGPTYRDRIRMLLLHCLSRVLSDAFAEGRSTPLYKDWGSRCFQSLRHHARIDGIPLRMLEYFGLTYFRPFLVSPRLVMFEETIRVLFAKKPRWEARPSFVEYTLWDAFEHGFETSSP